MLMRHTLRWTCCLMAAVVMFALWGCERQESASTATEKPAAAPAKPAEPPAVAPAEDTTEPEPKAPAEPAAPEPEVEEPGPAAEPAEPEPAEGETALDPMAKLKALSLLAAADKFDGQEDKIIARCASCALGMDGKKEHSLEFMDYTFYFCSADCQKRFGEDLVKSVLAMEIPGD